MDQSVVIIIVAIIALVIGIVLGKIIFAKNTKRQVEDAELQAQAILKEAELRAETIKKEKQLEAKERFVQLKAEHDKEVLERNKKLSETENRLKQKEININQKDASLEKQIKENEAIRISFKTRYERNIKEIEVLSGTTQTHLCSIYREMKNENSTQTQTYSVADTAAGNAIMYYIIKYTANNGNWAFTPVFKCQVQQ